MSKLSTLGFPTTLGISASRLPISDHHEKIEKKVWTGSDAERFALHATANTEAKLTLVPLIVVELEEDSNYICALKQINTGLYIIRRFTKNPKKIALAHHGFHTCFCPSHNSQWCVDIDDGFAVPDWFWNALHNIITP